VRDMAELTDDMTQEERMSARLNEYFLESVMPPAQIAGTGKLVNILDDNAPDMTPPPPGP
jgi:hypothetical protein